MNKRDLVDAVVATGLDRTSAERAVDAVTEAVSAALVAGDKVVVPAFGTFEVRQRAARSGRNPQTGESLEIAASRSAAFKPAAALKARLQAGEDGAS